MMAQMTDLLSNDRGGYKYQLQWNKGIEWWAEVPMLIEDRLGWLGGAGEGPNLGMNLK